MDLVVAPLLQRYEGCWVPVTLTVADPSLLPGADAFVETTPLINAQPQDFDPEHPRMGQMYIGLQHPLMLLVMHSE